MLLTGSPAWPNGFTAKVADFGLSRSMVDVSRAETSTYGTITHQPPEMLANGSVSKARPSTRLTDPCHACEFVAPREACKAKGGMQNYPQQSQLPTMACKAERQAWADFGFGTHGAGRRTLLMGLGAAAASAGM